MSTNRTEIARIRERSRRTVVDRAFATLEAELAKMLPPTPEEAADVAEQLARAFPGWLGPRPADPARTTEAPRRQLGRGSRR